MYKKTKTYSSVILKEKYCLFSYYAETIAFKILKIMITKK